jgi:hypothetical protein
MKAKLRLSWPHPRPGSDNEGNEKLYKIETVVGTVEFQPGQILTRDQVSDMCQQRNDLQVTMTSPPAPRPARRKRDSFDYWRMPSQMPAEEK